MNKISVESVEPLIKESNLKAVSQYMDGIQSHAIACQSWEEYKTNNKATFAIAYSENSLLLKYYITEQYLKATIRDINGDVHKDNCVEFFVAFEDEYYNLEFNCFGSVKVGYGGSRHGRTMLTGNIIEKIKIHTVLNSTINTSNDYFHWEILLIIPKEVFCFSSIESFEGLSCRANFYKCGDDLPDPHYLTWNMIETEKIDFHRPEFFGELFFNSISNIDQAYYNRQKEII